MKFIQGFDRNQIQFFAYEQLISPDNDVRLIDAFVHTLDLAACGFDMNFADNGRPAYHPSELLKLYLYGYLNRIRSSRALERECYRNVEVMWLLKGLTPDHNTISNFRRDNPKG
ncbi:MAG: transposase, partial [Flavobacteriaceae bacterium]